MNQNFWIFKTDLAFVNIKGISIGLILLLMYKLNFYIENVRKLTIANNNAIKLDLIARQKLWIFCAKYQIKLKVLAIYFNENNFGNEL